MNGHHLILGTTTDFLTGERIPDTHDERARQSVARILVEERGFHKREITPRHPLPVQADDQRAIVPVDFVVRLNNRVAMIIKYGPGSLVTRHRPALAASRLVAPYQIPVAVVTNGQGADILCGHTGKRLAQGLSNLPSRLELAHRCETFAFEPISRTRAVKEARIIYAYEVDDSCPCDDSICRLT